jgi:hypothetical protein
VALVHRFGFPSGKAVEKGVDMRAWQQKFAGDDPNDRNFFEVFAWPGLLEAAHAEMWPR